MGTYLQGSLSRFVEKYEFVREVRGMGLMQGLELTIPAGDIILKALDAGLIVISAGQNVIRFVPPLIIEEEHVDEMAAVLDGIFAKL